MFKEDKVADSIRLLMKMANIIDERGRKEPNRIGVDISSQDLSLGFRAWTAKLRDIINTICDLQRVVFDLKEQIYFQKLDMDSRLDLEGLTDEGAKKVRTYCAKVLNKENEELDRELVSEGEQTLTKYVLLEMDPDEDSRLPQIRGVFYDEDTAKEAAREIIKDLFEKMEAKEDADGCSIKECIEDCHAYFRVNADRYYVALGKC